MTTQIGDAEWLPEQADYRDAFRENMTGNPVSAKMCQEILEAPVTNMRLSKLARAVNNEFTSSDLYNRKLVSKSEFFLLGYRVPKINHGRQNFFRRCDAMCEYLWTGGPHRPPSQTDEPMAYYISQYIGNKINEYGSVGEAYSRLSPLCAVFTALISTFCDVKNSETAVDLSRFSPDGRTGAYVDGLSLNVEMEAEQLLCHNNAEEDIVSELRTQFMILARTSAQGAEVEPLPEKVEVTEWDITDDHLRFGIRLNPIEKQPW